MGIGAPQLTNRASMRVRVAVMMIVRVIIVVVGVLVIAILDMRVAVLVVFVIVVVHMHPGVWVYAFGQADGVHVDIHHGGAAHVGKHLLADALGNGVGVGE